MGRTEGVTDPRVPDEVQGEAQRARTHALRKGAPSASDVAASTSVSGSTRSAPSPQVFNTYNGLTVHDQTLRQTDGMKC